MSRPQLLVLRALGLGDLLTAVPALRGVRRAFPAHELVLATAKELTALAGAAGADRVLPARGPGPLHRPGAPDVAVNLHGRGPQSHRTLQHLSPRVLLAHACPEAGVLDGPPWGGDRHEVRRWCDMLGWYGIAAGTDDLLLRPPPLPAHLPYGATVVHPGAAGPGRRWPAERFAVVARQLAAEGQRVVLTGSPGERELAARVAARAGLSARDVLAGSTSLDELAAVVAHARLVVANDTGAVHLATAYRTPSVALFGPTSPDVWGPARDHGLHAIVRHLHAPVSAHPDTGAAPVIDAHSPAVARPARAHPAMLAITVAEVLDAVHRLPTRAAA